MALDTKCTCIYLITHILNVFSEFLIKTFIYIYIYTFDESEIAHFTWKRHLSGARDLLE